MGEQRDRYELGRVAFEAAEAYRKHFGDGQARIYHWDDLGLSDKEPYCQVAEAVAVSLAAQPADAAEGDARTGGVPLRSQVLELADLKAGWLDGDGTAYDPARLAAVADVLDRLVGLATANAFPMPNGRISVEWHNGRRSDSLEIDPHTLAMRMHLYDLDSGETIVGEIAPESLLAAAEKAGPGPATRELLKDLVEQRTHLDGGQWFFAQVDFDVMDAALAELGMEPPR